MPLQLRPVTGSDCPTTHPNTRPKEFGCSSLNRGADLQAPDEFGRTYFEIFQGMPPKDVVEEQKSDG